MKRICSFAGAGEVDQKTDEARDKIPSAHNAKFGHFAHHATLQVNMLPDLSEILTSL